MVKVREFLQKYAEILDLELVSGTQGLNRAIRVPEVDRPGLALSGFTAAHSPKRIILFGRVEMEYLRRLNTTERKKRLKGIISKQLPFIIIARRLRPLREIVDVCCEVGVALFRSKLTTAEMLRQLTVILGEEFARTTSMHSTLVEVHGVGVLIKGNSSVGKSETALGLIERGHRLVSDDVVVIKRQDSGFLYGSGPELTRHLLEIRGIGIINVAHLYGAICVSERATIDIIVQLEAWDDEHFYDRVGLIDQQVELLGVQVPYFVMPVKPGRDVVLLLETVVLSSRLKQMGYNSAKEFNRKLLDTIAKRQRGQGIQGATCPKEEV